MRKECSKQSRWERSLDRKASCAKAQTYEGSWCSLGGAKLSPPWATHRGSPRKGACVPLHRLGETEQSGREGRGRADGTTSREKLKEKLLPRQPRLPRPAVALCGYQPSTAARVNQDIRLPRLQAEGRGTPLKHERGRLGWGPRVGGLGGDPAWGSHLCRDIRPLALFCLGRS